MKYNFKNYIIRSSRDKTVADMEWMEDESMENWRSLTKGSDPAGYISKREDVDVRYKGKFANGLYKNKSVFLNLKFKVRMSRRGSGS